MNPSPQPETDSGRSCTSRSILEPEAPPEAKGSRTVLLGNLNDAALIAENSRPPPLAPWKAPVPSGGLEGRVYGHVSSFLAGFAGRCRVSVGATAAGLRQVPPGAAIRGDGVLALEPAELDDAADVHARLHVVVALVDLVKRVPLGDELVELELAILVVTEQPRHRLAWR